MKKLEREKLIEVVLYILGVTKGLDFYHVFKILYFAEREHLKLWGNRITSDDFLAMDYGPVPTHLYGAVKGRGEYESDLTALFNENIRFAGEDAPNVLLGNRSANLNYLSASDIQCLDKSIKDNAKSTFRQLLEKSHDSAWNTAYSNNVISPVKMAQSAGAGKEMLEYIEEQMMLENLLA